MSRKAIREVYTFTHIISDSYLYGTRSEYTLVESGVSPKNRIVNGANLLIVVFYETPYFRARADGGMCMKAKNLLLDVSARKTITRLLALPLGISILWPLTATAVTLSLSDAISQAQEKSPDVGALRHQADSARAKARQALSPTEPTFQITYNDMEQPTSFTGRASSVYSLTQPIAFPGKAWVTRSVQSKQAQALEAQMRSTELQVSANVKAAYYQLSAARQNLQLDQQQKVYYERILAIAKRRYESGSITQVDLLNAQVSMFSIENDMNDIGATEKSALAQLNVALKNPTDTAIEVEPIKVVRKTRPSLEEAEKRMLEKRNEIRAARFQADAADNSKTLAWMGLLPDFQLTAGTTYYNIPVASPLNGGSGNTHTYFVGVQMTLPIWFIFNERENIVSATHDMAAAESSLTSVLNQSRTTLVATLQQIESTEKKIDNYEKHLIPLAEQSLNLALINYSAGKVDFQALSESATARLNTTRDYLATSVVYLTSYATLSQLLGEEL